MGSKEQPLNQNKNRQQNDGTDEDVFQEIGGGKMMLFGDGLNHEVGAVPYVGHGAKENRGGGNGRKDLGTGFRQMGDLFG